MKPGGIGDRPSCLQVEVIEMDIEELRVVDIIQRPLCEMSPGLVG